MRDSLCVLFMAVTLHVETSHVDGCKVDPALGERQEHPLLQEEAPRIGVVRDPG